MSAVHACPLGGGEFTRCCNREVTELAVGDRVTSVIDNVTCLELLLKESRMTEIVPVPAVVPSVSESGEDAGFEVMRADAVLTGRAMSSAEFLTGLILNGQLETAGRPDKLARDMWLDENPALIQAVWERALAVGFHAGRTSVTPRLYRDQMDRITGQFEEAGYQAMGRSVARARRLVAPELAHPADGESGRGH